MVDSLRRLIAIWLVATLFLACSAGEGEGMIIATVWAPDCGLEAEVIDLKPNFFSLTPTEDANALNFRVQHGSHFEIRSNGVIVQVSEAEAFKTMLLGEPIDLSDPLSPVKMNLYLGRRCDDIRDAPVNYEAVSGSITFDAIYVPWVDGGQRLSAARFTDVEFVDRNEAATRHATASGEFSFLFERGRPAQWFP